MAQDIAPHTLKLLQFYDILSVEYYKQEEAVMAKKKAPFKHQAVVDAIVAQLKQLPDGTETSTSQVVENLYGKMNFTDREYDYGTVAFTFHEYFDVDYRVRKQAKKVGLLLDDTPCAGMEIGLPFNCPYIVRENSEGRIKPMMISPEGYYNSELAGRSHEQILRKIAGLKRRIAELKRTMEHPDYAPTMYPTEETQLWCMRLYLERAKEALAEVGAPYEPTVPEQRVMDFDANINNIEKITLNIGGFFSGWRKYTVRLDDQLHFWVEDMMIPTPTNFDIPADEPMTKEDFLCEFRELHIGEWRRSYDTERFGYEVLDGTQWEFSIEYNNGRKTFTSNGSNAYPYNFKKLTDLFGIENDEEKNAE